MKIKAIHTPASETSVLSAQTMPKAPTNSPSGQEEDPPSFEWEEVSRCQDKGRDKGRDEGRDKGTHKGLTHQPPKESEFEVDPSRTNSLGGKRNWATDSDSDGQADPPKKPTKETQMLPWQHTPSHAAASAATASAAAMEVHKDVNITTVNMNVTPLVSLFLAILANLASQTHLATQPTQTLLARGRGPLSAGACLGLQFNLRFGL
jgi:hypothetical protein